MEQDSRIKFDWREPLLGGNLDEVFDLVKPKLNLFDSGSIIITSTPNGLNNDIYSDFIKQQQDYNNNLFQVHPSNTVWKNKL